MSLDSQCIDVFQKNWAFTSSDSDKPKIRTGSFGPCFVVTFSGKKFAAMAHIDPSTDVKTVSSIFKKFSENSVNPSEVKAIILGGWDDGCEVSLKGRVLVQTIQELGCRNISIKNMFSKRFPSLLQRMMGYTLEEVKEHYHQGALIDAAKGKTYLLRNNQSDLDDKQRKICKENPQMFFFKRFF